MDVFISYARADEHLAQQVASLLEAHDVSYFLAPKDIRGGEPFADRIRSELWAAKHIFVLLSPDSIKSEWVTTEWGAAWVLDKHIVPILHRCDIDDIPSRLAHLQVRDFHEIPKIILELQALSTTPRHIPEALARSLPPARTVLFDIDGTVLGPVDNMTTGIGHEFLELLSRLSERDYEFVFITGNDYTLQEKRVLTPIINRGLGHSVFCFSDGGSRAFEYNESAQVFREIEAYSQQNLMSDAQVEVVLETFEEQIPEFLERDPGLKLPHVLWYDRTLNYLDLIIYPLRPSFIGSQDFDRFCERLEHFFRHSSIKTATFDMIKGHPGALVLRAYGRSPESDVNQLQDMINRILFVRPEFQELSKPESERRGGDVTCQIALKPFSDDDTRREFRGIMARELEAKAQASFLYCSGAERPSTCN